MKLSSFHFLLLPVFLFLFIGTGFSKTTIGDCRNGFGVSIFDNGDIYAGYWQNGVQSGTGAYFWKASGGRYVGNWVNGNEEVLAPTTIKTAASGLSAAGKTARI